MLKAIVNNGGSGGGSPAGSTSDIQYNNLGAFAADSGFTRDPSTHLTNIEAVVETNVTAGLRVDAETFTFGDVSGAFATLSNSSTGNHVAAGVGDLSALGLSTDAGFLCHQDTSGDTILTVTDTVDGLPTFITRSYLASATSDGMEVRQDNTQFNIATTGGSSLLNVDRVTGNVTITNSLDVPAIGENNPGAIQGFMPTNYQTGTTYTLALTDSGQRVSLTNGSAVTLTVPPHSGVAFPNETEITIRQGGAGQVTVNPGVGVTINSYLGLTNLAGQYAYATLKLSSTANTWDLFGNLA